MMEPQSIDFERQWRQALKAVMRPLIHPEKRFVVLFSAKSACSSVVIWFLHTLGLAEEARRHHEWPHAYRIDKLYQRPDYLGARASLCPEQARILRVVRDPVERAVSSFKHALGTGYARESILRALGIDIAEQGLSFERFIEFLESEDLQRCDPHHRLQCHPVEQLRRPDRVLNVSHQSLFEGLNEFERSLGMPVTDFRSLRWVHELQAAREPRSGPEAGDSYRQILTQEQARHGPWPRGLLTSEARARLECLYSADIRLYAP
jgi:hypothetical protein